MPTYLADIVASHRARAADDGRRLSDLLERAARAPMPRDFSAALRGEGLTCIAEIKRRSPSKGDLDPGLQPEQVAKEYAAGGASCLSVLTDEQFFGGSAADLMAARRASGLPVLRKDFTVCEADVVDAAPDGSRCGPAHRRRARRRRAGPVCGGRPRARAHRARGGARRGGARPGASRRLAVWSV